MNKILKYGFLLLLCMGVFPKAWPQTNITTVEYWFDNAFSTRQQQSIAANPTIHINELLNSASLSTGLHTLLMRAKDSKGEYSPATAEVFYKYPVSDSAAIVAYEYWTDNDFADRILLPVSANNPFILLNSLDMAACSTGIHTLNIRAKDAKGLYSTVHRQTFLKTQSGTDAAIVSYEYWIDSDFNLRTVVPVFSNSSFVWLEDLDMSASSKGIHTLQIRAKDSKGLYSVVQNHLFFKGEILSGNQIMAYRYWFDNDFAGRTNIILPTPETPHYLQAHLTIPATFNHNEKHVFHIQYQDVSGQWGAPTIDTFELIKIIPQSEFAALKEFYAATSGNQWTNTVANNQVWDTSDIATVKHWKGVTVENGNVKKLALPNNKLTGYIPASFTQLQLLDTLLLNQNAVLGIETILQANITGLDIKNQVVKCDSLIVTLGDTVYLRLPSVALYQHAAQNFGGLPVFTLKINGSSKSGNFTATDEGYLKVPYSVAGIPVVNHPWELTQTTGNAQNSKYTYTVKQVITPVTSISVTPKTKILNIGDTLQLQVAFTPANATNKNVSYSSSDTLIAKVDVNGKVKVTTGGIVNIIICSEDGTKKDTCKLTINTPVTNVVLNKDTLQLPVNGTETLIAAISPSNATNKSLTWASLNTGIATVGTDGLVTAKTTTGTTFIVVTTQDGSFKDTCIVVVKRPVTGINLATKILSMNVGDQKPIEVNVLPLNATNPSITKISRNPSIAAINDSSMVQAVSAGSTYIVFTTADGGFKDSCLITVTSIQELLTVTQIPSITCMAGDSVNSIVFGGSSVPSTFYKWTNSNQGIGLAASGINTMPAFMAKNTGVNPLSATITVTPGVVSGGDSLFGSPMTFTITVNASTPIPVAVTGINLTTKALTMQVGDWVSLSANVVPVNATNPSITKISRNPSIAAINDSSMVQAVSAGSTYIVFTTADGGFKDSCLITVTSIQELLTVTQIPSITCMAGDNVNSIVFGGSSVPGTFYKWTNSNQGIGLAASGTNTMPAFMAKNTGTNPLSAIITVTPGVVSGGDSLFGSPMTFTITVNASTPIPVAVTGINLTTKALTMQVGDWVYLSANVVPVNATNPFITKISRNTSIAAINDSSMVQAVSAGYAYIVFTTADGGFKDSCLITVTQPISSNTTCETAKLVLLGSNEFTTNSLEQWYKFIPTETATYKVTVPEGTSTYTGFAGKGSCGSLVGIPNGIYSKDSTYYLWIVSQNTQSFTWILEKAIPVTGISLSPKVLTWQAGNEYSLNSFSVSVIPANADNRGITFFLMDTILKYNSTNYTLKAVSAGSTYVVFTTMDGGFKDSCLITVTPLTVPVASVSLSSKNLALKVDSIASLTAAVMPVDASNKAVIWESTNPNVATVANGVITAKSAGTAFIIVKSQDGTKADTCVVTVTGNTVPVASVSLSSKSLTLKVDSIASLTAAVMPVDASNKAVVWESTNPNVATVANGVITAKSAGTAFIIVKSQDGTKADTCVVTVTGNTVPVASVSLSSKNVTLKVDSIASLTAAVMPVDASNKAVIWESTNPNVATVANGVITARSAGTTFIIVKSQDGTKADTCVVTIIGNTVAVNGISLTPKTLFINIGEQKPVTVGVVPAYASNQTILRTSRNTHIATIDDSTQMIRAISAGSTYVVFTTQDGGFKDSCLVTVNAASIYVTGINLNTHKLSMNVYDRRNVSATVLPNNADNKKVTAVSRNTSIAAIDDNFNVSAVSAGATYIVFTTSDGGFQDSCLALVNATEPPIVNVNNIRLGSHDLTMIADDWQYLPSTISPANATNKSVSRISRNPAVASIDSSSVIKALASGSTYIVFTTQDGHYQDSCLVTVKPKLPNVNYVSAIRLSARNLALFLGETGGLFASVLPANATNKNYSYVSRNPAIASIDESLDVQAKAKGSTYIVFTSEDGNFKDSCLVTVKTNSKANISGNVLHQNREVVKSGFVSLYLAQSREQYVLTASVAIESDGSYLFEQIAEGNYLIKATPAKSENAMATYYGNTENWSAATVVIVENTTAIQGKNITLIEMPALAGNSIINGYVAEVLDKKILTKAPVENPSKDAVVLLQVYQNAKWVTVAQTQTNEQGYYEFNHVPVGEYRVVVDIAGITMEEPRIIEIVEDGVEISGQDYGISDEGISTEELVPVLSMSISEKTLTINEGEEASLSVKFNPVNASNQAVTWRSQNSQVVSVDANGTIKGLAKGQTYITATSEEGGFKDSCLVTVEEPTGIAKTEVTEERCKVYPNPVINGKLTVEYSERLLHSVRNDGKIEIYNLAGKLVGTYSLPLREAGGAAITLDISHLPSGTYLVKVAGQITKVVKL